MTKLPKTKLFPLHIPSSNYFEAHKIQHLHVLTIKNRNKNTLLSTLKQNVQIDWILLIFNFAISLCKHIMPMTIINEKTEYSNVIKQGAVPIVQ